jgi:hypothetical protein
LEGTDSFAVLQRFSHALKDAPVSLFTQDRSLRYLWVHNPFPGLTDEDIIGKTDAEFLLAEEAQQLEEIKRSVISQGKNRRATIRMTVNNQVSFFDLVLQPWRNQAGEVDGISGAAVEITDIISASQAGYAALGDGDETLPFLLDSESRARLLASLSRSFAETGNDFPAILETITQLVAGVAGDACVIRLTGEDGQNNSRVASYYVNPPSEVLLRSLVKQVSESFRKLFEESVAQNGEALVIADFMKRIDLVSQLPEAVADWLKEFPIHAVMICRCEPPGG